jgi:hypothetical protein
MQKQTEGGMRTGLFTTHQIDGARDFFKGVRKRRAIDRIKAQPFFK